MYAPPKVDRRPFEVSEHWERLQDERFDTVVTADTPAVWGDAARSGKTTNAARAAAGRELPHHLSFQTHRKAREFGVDDATPDGYYHPRGGAQKDQTDYCFPDGIDSTTTIYFLD